MVQAFWYSFIFVAGAASIAVEIAGLRLLAPLFGSSLPVWGTAIATVLAGLAIGYAKGGRLAQREPTKELVFRLAALGATLFLWMPTAFALAHRLPALGAFALAYLALFFPSVIFGLLSPLIVQTEANRKNQPAGQVAGRVSAISTIGSLVGILLPSFITIPLLGTQATVWLFAGLLLAFCAAHFLIFSRLFLSVLALAAAAVGSTPLLQPQDPTIIFAAETQHQYVTVRQTNTARRLSYDADLGTQSIITNSLYADGYWDYLAALPALLPHANDNISVLVIGAAASTTERQLQRFWDTIKNPRFTSVELDGDLFPIADAYFDPPERRQVTADGRRFMTTDTGAYDMIVVDVYAREMTVPFHVATKEFFDAARHRLTPAGIVAININALSADTLWVRSLARTLSASFPELRLVEVPRSCNWLLLASEAQLDTANLATQNLPPALTPLLPTLQSATAPRTDGLLLTDDRSPTDLLGLAALTFGTPTPSCRA